jgi:hypothetical protein
LRREHLEVGDDLSPNYVHHFTQREIELELSESGFDLQFYSDRQYGHAVGRAS